MSSIVKYVALLSIVFSAGLAFVNAFVPEYEQWREKYPPEVEEDEDDTPEGDVQVQKAEDLFNLEAKGE